MGLRAGGGGPLRDPEGAGRVTAGGPGAPAAPAAATQRTFRIVISYRRVDTGGDARSLAEALRRRFGNENVFLDIETIGPGEPFDQAIDRAVDSSDVLLALIGQHWLAVTDDEGRRRIDDPKDVVRVEILSALQRQLVVIPVLLEDATMPSEEELPPDLAPFSKRNAVELRGTKWESDVESFVDDLAEERRKKFRRLGAGRGWRRVVAPLGDAVWAVRRAAGKSPRVAAAVTLLLLLLLAALVAVLVLRNGDGSTGGSGGGEALHPPLAEDETLAFVSGNRVVILDGDAKNPLPLTVADPSESVDWTADGRLVYSDGGNLWIVEPDGKPQPLTTDRLGDGHPSVRKDDGLVAFNRPVGSDGKCPCGIWLVPADRSIEPHPPGEGEPIPGVAPDWSSDGRRIAYQRRRDESGDQHIWFMDEDGQNQRELLPSSNEPAMFPAWAPSGNRIAFWLPDESGCRIGIARPDQDVLEPELRFDTPATCSGPEWSPDGRYLAVTAPDGIWAIRVDGTEDPQLLLDIESPKSLSWVRRRG